MSKELLCVLLIQRGCSIGYLSFKGRVSIELQVAINVGNLLPVIWGNPNGYPICIKGNVPVA
jgi:hypothetical protein